MISIRNRQRTLRSGDRSDWYGWWYHISKTGLDGWKCCHALWQTMQNGIINGLHGNGIAL